MKFLFKLKIYLFILGYLFLQGCQTTDYNAYNSSNSSQKSSSKPTKGSFQGGGTNSSAFK